MLKFRKLQEIFLGMKLKGIIITAILAFTATALSAQAPSGAPAQPRIAMPTYIPVMNETVEKTTFEYSVKGEEHLLLDKYVDYTVDYEGPRPVMIYAYGGAFAGGSRSMNLQVAYYKHFVERGFVVVAIDYRLGAKNGAGDNMSKHVEQDAPEGFATRFDWAVRIACEDMIDATAYVLSKADEWGIDTSKIILSGGSAGAITCLNAAYEVAGEREFSVRLPKDFNYAGVISHAGCIYTPDEELVWKRTPCPVLFFHGTSDPVVPFNTRDQGGCHCYGSNYIHNQWVELDYSHWLYEETGSDHIIAMTPMGKNDYEIDNFIDKFIMQGKHIIMHTVFTQTPAQSDATVGYRIFDND